MQEQKIIVAVDIRKNIEKYLALLNAGVFDLDSGRVEINVHNGQIQTVHIHKMTYKRQNGTV